MFEALDELDNSEISKNTDLLVPIAYALILSRRFNQALYYLEMLKKLLNSTKKERIKNKRGNVLTVDIFLEHILLLFQREDTVFTDPLLGELSMRHNNLNNRAFAMLIVPYEHLYKGLLLQAFRIANQAKTLLSKSGHKTLESYADLIIILCDRYQGRRDKAVQYMASVYSKPAAEASKDNSKQAAAIFLVKLFINVLI